MNKRNRDCERRQLLLDELRSRHDHPTAVICYLSMKKQIPGIGQSTIYRHLNELTKQGLIEEISFPGQPARYDANIKSHAHFYCTECGSLTDLEAMVNAHWPSPPQSVLVMAEGTCKDCSKPVSHGIKEGAKRDRKLDNF